MYIFYENKTLKYGFIIKEVVGKKVVMKLDAHLEIVNNLANGFRKNQSLYSQLSFAKDTQSNKYVLLIKNTKKPNADKFRVSRLL